MKIIPAIDIIGGNCVRLTQGDYNSVKVYSKDPLAIARSFEALGVKRLHLVDLDGAKSGDIKNLEVLKTIAVNTSLEIDFSGGISNSINLQRVFDAGARWAGVGSIVVKDPGTFKKWIAEFGQHRFLIGADVIKEKIAVSGWTQNTDLSVWDMIETQMHEGVRDFFCTDIDKDGKLQGPSLDLYRRIIEKFPEIRLIASGGITSMNDLQELKEIMCNGAIIGKAIYEGLITNEQLRTYINAG